MRRLSRSKGGGHTSTERWIRGKYPGVFAQSDTRCRSGETLLLKNSVCIPHSDLTVDKNAAYPKALNEVKAAEMLPTACELRQRKYLNNLIEQDHRFIKLLVKPGMGFFSFETAWRTLQGYEVMHMLRKGQIKGVSKCDILSQVALVSSLFGVAA